MTPVTIFTLLGIGAMNSPRYAPAGLLIEHGQVRVAIDGGPGAEPAGIAPLAASANIRSVPAAQEGNSRNSGAHAVRVPPASMR